jgi:hypothetical protein
VGDDSADPPRPKKPGLEDTQEMERVRPLGFFEADEAEESRDPWNDVTPQDLSAEPPAPDHNGHEVAEDLYLGDGPFAAPSDRIPEERAMRIADPRSPSAISRFALATNALSQPVAVQRNTKNTTPQPRSQSGIRIGDAAVAIARRMPSGVGRPTEIMRAHHQVPVQEPPPSRRYQQMRALLKNPEKIPYGTAPISKPKPPPVPGTFIPAGKREKEPPPAPSSPADLDQMLATMAEGLLIGEDANGHAEVRVTLRDEFFAGTELRIKMGEDGVSAILVPPDRSTYLTLNGNVDDLRIRLESRGLRVSQIRVAEP